MFRKISTNLSWQPRSKDYWFRVTTALQADYHRGLSPAACGIAFSLRLHQQHSHDGGCTADLRKLTRLLGFRDKRTLWAPICELLRQRKMILWQDRLYSPLVCIERYNEAKRRREQCPIPPEVGGRIDAMETEVNNAEKSVEELRKLNHEPHELELSQPQVQDQASDWRS
jgi:hypothetical protein